MCGPVVVVIELRLYAVNAVELYRRMVLHLSCKGRPRVCKFHPAGYHRTSYQNLYCIQPNFMVKLLIKLIAELHLSDR